MLTRKLLPYSWITLIILLCILDVILANDYDSENDEDDYDDNKNQPSKDKGSDKRQNKDTSTGNNVNSTKPAETIVNKAPQNKDWLSEIDLSDVVGKVRPVGSGICKEPKCDGTDNDLCFESCGNVARPEDVYGCPNAKTWALSFDDGPSNVTVDLLNFLDEADVKVTFCVMGSQAQQYPDILKRAYESGHQIASHTWSHPHLMSLTNEEIVYEIRSTEEAIEKAIGVRPRYIRPPYGEADDRVKSIFKKLGYKTLMWNVDPTDYNVYMMPDGGEKIQKAFDNIINGVPSLLNAHNDPGYISLQHDLYNTSMQQVPKIIQALKNNGYTLTTAAQCIGDSQPHAEPDSPRIPVEDEEEEDKDNDDLDEDAIKDKVKAKAQTKPGQESGKAPQLEQVSKKNEAEQFIQATQMDQGKVEQKSPHNFSPKAQINQPQAKAQVSGSNSLTSSLTSLFLIASFASYFL